MTKYISCHKCNKNGRESYACICGTPEEQIYPHGSIMQAQIDQLTAEVELLASENERHMRNVGSNLYHKNLDLEKENQQLTEEIEALNLLVQNIKEMADDLDNENQRLRDDYSDLIMQVAKKFPDESRHETAKRYIMERENREVSPAQQALEGEGER